MIKVTLSVNHKHQVCPMLVLQDFMVKYAEVEYKTPQFLKIKEEGEVTEVLAVFDIVASQDTELPDLDYNVSYTTKPLICGSDGFTIHSWFRTDNVTKQYHNRGRFIFKGSNLKFSKITYQVLDPDDLPDCLPGYKLTNSVKHRLIINNERHDMYIRNFECTDENGDGTEGFFDTTLKLTNPIYAEATPKTVQYNFWFDIQGVK